MLKRIIIGFILLLSIFLYLPESSGQKYTSVYNLNWQIITNFQNKKINAPYFLGFTNAGYTNAHPTTPVFSTRIAVAAKGNATVQLQNEVYVEETDTVILKELSYLPARIDLNVSQEEINHRPVESVGFIPIRKNPFTGIIEKLTGFSLVLTVVPSSNSTVNNNRTSSESKKGPSGSLLASGDWYKIGVTQTGIYKLDNNFLKSVGISDITKVKIYGRPGGMLPQLNSIPRDTDLVQNAVQVVNPNGSADASSYVLFYANGPTSWTWDTNLKRFHHQINYYSDISYYFITGDGDPAHAPKRISPANSITGSPTNDISSFDAYDYHELDTLTSITTSVRSGREWYGESFDALNNTQLHHAIQFNFPQADLSGTTYIRTSTAARSYPIGSSFDFSLDDGNSYILRNGVIPTNTYDDFNYEYADVNDNASIAVKTPSSHLSVQVRFNDGDPALGLGWLNYIEFNVQSQLKYIPGQFNFRNGNSDTFDLKPYDTVVTLMPDSNFIAHNDTFHSFYVVNGNIFYRILTWDTTIIANGDTTMSVNVDTLAKTTLARWAQNGYRPITGDSVHYISNSGITYFINSDTVKQIVGNIFRPILVDTITRINRYHISGVFPANYQVWDVTDFHNIVSVPLVTNSGEMDFLAYGEQIREFVSNDGSGYLTPTSYGKIANQDLHSLPQPDMVIVTYPDFEPAADSIAAYHRQHDNFVVNVVTPDQVYNEFSSGTQDISAIKDMMKMFYDRAGTNGKSPQFLLLVGAASYDYKNRVANHTNFVPVYEGYQSIEQSTSFCSDDFYTLLADNEGAWPDDEINNEPLQLSVGRFPVYNLQEAFDVFHKVERYNSPPNLGAWRNKIAVIADDRQDNTFEDQAETITQGVIVPQDPVFNLDKLYLDATPELDAPAGQLFPQINTDIDNDVNGGCLVMDYIGHGSQLQWAVEDVVTIPQIEAWHNLYNMPLIISATCQFSTYDDPNNVSAGEDAMLNPNGGPVAMFTTTREVEITDNQALNTSIISNNLFQKINGQAKYMGQSFMQAKNTVQIQSNSRNFALLGDPAVRLAVPEYNVKITKISRDSMGSDTFKALAVMSVSGEIDSSGTRMKNFNGDVYPTVFDKTQIEYTLGQASGDPNDSDYPMAFSTQNSLIYRGRATVTNGEFTFQFVVPKDIAFNYGVGKLSFYADNGIVDANGYSDSIVVGGGDLNAVINFQPPVVHLFMNDTNFVAGGLVNNNPNLVARIRSNVGINTLGSIGHNLTATLTKYANDSNSTVILDNYYTSDKNSYKSGTITYPFENLADGHYGLNVKIWDVADNSAEASTDFIVANSSNLTIDKIFNYPNPFRDETTFVFDDNEPNQTLHVDIEIFDLRGNLVRDIQSDIFTTGDRQNTIHWNGTESGGAKIASGLYVYQLTVKTLDGQVARKSQKLMVIN